MKRSFYIFLFYCALSCSGQDTQHYGTEATFLSESAIAEAQIPIKIIHKKLNKKYAGWEVVGLSKIEDDTLVYLKAEIVKNDSAHSVFFTTKGKWYKGNFDEPSNTHPITNQNAHYQFTKPDSTYRLPTILKEISGIAPVDEHTIYCVQDETGTVFEYDLYENAIEHEYRFFGAGDFEDITIVDDTTYVLRSDGTIFQFNCMDSEHATQQKVTISAHNFESLFYDATSKLFYITSKDMQGKPSESSRTVFRYHPNKISGLQSYINIDAQKILERYGAEYPQIMKGQDFFQPSALAIHPITHELYVLSAFGRYLAIFGPEGVRYFCPLPAHLFYQPEGIAFLKNGDLLIASEGDAKETIPAIIHLFKYRN